MWLQHLFDLLRCVLEDNLEVGVFKALEIAIDWWVVESLTYPEGRKES